MSQFHDTPNPEDIEKTIIDASAAPPPPAGGEAAPIVPSAGDAPESERGFNEAATVADDFRSAVAREQGSDAPQIRTEAISPAERRKTLEKALPGNPLALAPRIAGYRVTRVLASGGMGTVYEAEQQSPRRRVALKVIRAGQANVSLLKRLEYEAHILGLLHHPGIAQIYEAGSYDAGDGPQPYFAMELVEGLPLTRFAEFKKLSTRDRLELMVKVCEAVHHAHQKGVIHRDLKPENILVEDNGQPKVLDFGVARVVNQEMQSTTLKTKVGMILGTVSYMSPEQVSGNPDDIDTRADVYALGVLGYQLLSGKFPLDFREVGLIEAVRMIRESEPLPLSAHDRAFRGDLETIFSKSLDKDKLHRYESATEMAGDIRRYLCDEPIIARPPTTLYQLAKFARRNRTLVLGAVSVFFVLMVGIVTTYWQARAAQRQRDKAEKVADFLVEIFSKADPRAGLGRAITAREILGEGARRIAAGDLQDDPAMQVKLLRMIGSAFTGVHEFDESVRMHEKALEQIRLQSAGIENSEVAGQMILLGEAYSLAGKHMESVRTLTDALDLNRRLEREGAEVIDRNLGALAISMARQAEFGGRPERFAEAGELLRKNAKRIAARYGEHSNRHALALDALAHTLMASGSRDPEIGEIHLRSIDIRKRLRAEAGPEAAQTLFNLAGYYAGVGKYDLAEESYRQSLDIRRTDPTDPAFADTLWALGYFIDTHGRSLRDAAECYREYTQIYWKVFREESPRLPRAEARLAWTLARLGEHEEAREWAAKSLAGYQRLVAPDDAELVRVSELCIALMIRAREFDKAEALSRDLAAWRAEKAGQASPIYARSLDMTARVLYARGDQTGARRLRARAREIRLAAGP